MTQPKQDSFENAFKEAFDKASLAPPDIIWENIEKTLPQETIVGTKSDGTNSAIQTKLIIGTGIVLVSVITYLYLNNSSSNNIKSNLNPTKNETIYTKPIEPAIVDSKIEIENLAANTTFVTKKNFRTKLKSIPPVEQKTDINPEIDINDAPDFISLQKNEVIVSEIKPKGLHLPVITLDTPDLVPNTDSQYVAPYYDPNAIESIGKTRRPFWERFKISGGIRVSN